jgi:quercetin dioxygenase-like cupin family protein
MPKPESPQHGVVFDLADIERALREEDNYERNGHAARTLIRMPDLRVVLMVMRAEGRLASHHADETASIYVLSGQLRLHLPNREVSLSAGKLLVLQPGLTHDVDATTDSAFMLTLGWDAER